MRHFRRLYRMTARFASEFDSAKSQVVLPGIWHANSQLPTYFAGMVGNMGWPLLKQRLFVKHAPRSGNGYASCGVSRRDVERAVAYVDAFLRCQAQPLAAIEHRCGIGLVARIFVASYCELKIVAQATDLKTSARKAAAL